jgi:RNA polymerase sigma-70 factor, ECF subfamily
MEAFPWGLTAVRARRPLSSRVSLSVDEKSARAVAGARVEPPTWELFEALVRRHHRELRAFAYRLIVDSDRTDDVLQEAYLRAFRAFPRFDPSKGSELGWLYRIVYRCCADEWRRQRRASRRVVLVADPDVAARELGQAPIERVSLLEALAKLSPEVRAALVLVDWRGLDYAAAGEILGIPAGTVGSRLNKGRRVLRDVLAVEEQPDERRE